MLQISFYQLKDTNADNTLLMLVKKTIALGKKMLVFCPKPTAFKVNDVLWTHEPKSWLPHGIDTELGAEVSSVWICSDMTNNPINADYLMLLDGAIPESWNGFKRAFIVFNESSQSQMQWARSHWKECKGQPNVKLDYFAQDANGHWKVKYDGKEL